MNWQDKIVEAHLSVTDRVSHYRKLRSDRYFVWEERDRSDLIAEGRHAERVMVGYTDLFTKIENDPWADAIEEAFENYGIAWSLNDILYEDDTGFIHYAWSWEVTDG